MRPSGAARVAGVMGWPVKHSRSPTIHGHWLERYGIDGAYVPFNVPPERVGDAVRALATLGFAGTNLTLPHKETVLPFLDDIDPVARRIGAVNTVTVQEDGALLGSNTDAFGFIEHLRAEVPSWSPGVAAVLGAGGAARAVVAALVDAGAAEIRLANRTPERSERLAEGIDGPVIPVPWEYRCGSLEGADLLVNTTSLGMEGRPALGMTLAGLRPDAVVYDIVYVPMETELLASARRAGLAAVDGLGMLLHQARPGFAAWFGREPDVDAELRRVVMEGL